MVQIWSMLAARDTTLAVEALQNLPVEPSTATWITYLRCHDDIGWAIDDDENISPVEPWPCFSSE